MYYGEYFICSLLFNNLQEEILLGGPHGLVVKDAVGSSLARVTCETSQVLLGGGQVVFLGDLPFLPYLTIDLTQIK